MASQLRNCPDSASHPLALSQTVDWDAQEQQWLGLIWPPSSRLIPGVGRFGSRFRLGHGFRNGLGHRFGHRFGFRPRNRLGFRARRRNWRRRLGQVQRRWWGRRRRRSGGRWRGRCSLWLRRARDFSHLLNQFHFNRRIVDLGEFSRSSGLLEVRHLLDLKTVSFRSSRSIGLSL